MCGKARFGGAITTALKSQVQTAAVHLDVFMVGQCLKARIKSKLQKQRADAVMQLMVDMLMLPTEPVPGDSVEPVPGDSAATK